MARGAFFDPNVDPQLMQVMAEVTRNYKKRRAEIFSGNSPRPANPNSYHPGTDKDPMGHALDVQLYDPETGDKIDNFQDPSSAADYQDYANEVYKYAAQHDPELAKQLRWGGYFKGGRWNRDWMHFDRDVKGIGMGGGSWAGGFDPEYVKQAGLQSAGGVGDLLGGPNDDAVVQMAQQGYSRQQILDALASIESKGRGYAAVGQDADPAHHRARGRYQVMDYNIQPWAKQYLNRDDVTVDSFMADPKLQDELAGTVMEDYIKQYGLRGAYSKWFTGSEKEPDVTDVNGKYNGKSYADAATAYLDQISQHYDPRSDTPSSAHPTGSDLPGTPASDSPSESGGAHFGGGGLGQPKLKDDKQPKSKWGKFGEELGKGLSGGSGLGTGSMGSGVTAQPAAVLAQGTPTTIGDINGQEAEYRRANLANIMARLNTQKLW